MGGDRLGSVKLFLCQDVKSLCRGLISNSGDNRFCVRAKCDVKSHRVNKIMIKEGHLYIRGNRKEQALVEPSLDTLLLSASTDVEQLAETAKPVNVWRTYFTSEMASKDRATEGSGRSWEEVEAPALTKLSEVEGAYNTPRRLKAGFIMAALADTIPIGIGKAEAIQEIEGHLAKADGDERESAKDSSIHTVLAKWNKICAGIDLFNDEFTKLGKGEEKSRESITATVLRIHDAIWDTDARASLLASSIGPDDTSASGEGAESVWDTIRRVCNTLDEVQGLVDDGSREILGVHGQVTAFQEKMGNMSQNLIGLKKYVVDSLAVIHRKVLDLGEGGPVVGSGSQDAVISNLAFDQLKDRLAELEDKARAYARVSTRHEETGRLEVDVEALRRRMDKQDHEDKNVTQKEEAGPVGS
jgi:hypothetical protein